MSEYPDDILGAARFALMGHRIQVDFGAERKERMVEDIARVLLLEREAKDEWQDISTAPKDNSVVDVWSSYFGRLTDYRRVDLGNGNVFYAAIRGGLNCVRDATHWMPLPSPPAPSKPKQVEAAQS